MAFATGYYELAVSEGCALKLKRILRGSTDGGAAILNELESVREEIGTSGDIGDIEQLEPNRNDYGITIDGYRFHLRINQAHLVITIIDAARVR